MLIIFFINFATTNFKEVSLFDPSAIQICAQTIALTLYSADGKSGTARSCCNLLLQSGFIFDQRLKCGNFMKGHWQKTQNIRWYRHGFQLIEGPLAASLLFMLDLPVLITITGNTRMVTVELKNRDMTLDRNQTVATTKSCGTKGPA
jgi:hypothetical protein